MARQLATNRDDAGTLALAGVACPRPGALCALVFTNAGTQTRYLLLWDAGFAPEPGSALPPLLALGQPSGVAAPLVLDERIFGPGGVALRWGLAWAISTSAAGYVAGAVAAQHTLLLVHDDGGGR